MRYIKNIMIVVFGAIFGMVLANTFHTCNTNIPVVTETVETIQSSDSNTFIVKDETVLKFATYPYSISEIGKEHIKEYESLRLEPYWIGKNPRPSIGYGHQILDNENFTKITKAEAEAIFEKDIEKTNASINRLLKNINKKFKFSQGFIDGLGSLIYNCGEYGVSQTEFYQRLNNCRYDDSVESNINQSDYNYTIAAVKNTKVTYAGHKPRRQAEYQMMIN